MNKKSKKLNKILLFAAIICFIFIFFSGLVKFASIAVFNISTGTHLNLEKLKVGANSAHIINLEITDKNKSKILSISNIKILYKFSNLFTKKSIVRRIEIIGPELDLKRVDSEKWNTSFLFKKKKPPVKAKKKPIYDGEIEITGGNISIEDKIVAKKILYFNNINFSYNYADKNKTIAGTIGGGQTSKVEIYGRIQNNKLYTNLKTKNLSIPDHINFLLPNRRDFLFLDGFASYVDIDFITNVFSGITDYQGAIYLDKGSFYSRFWPYKFSDLSGKINLFNNCLFAKRLIGNFGAVPANVSGTLNDFSYPYLNLHINGYDFDINLIKKFWEKDFNIVMEGKVSSAHVDIKGKADKSVVSAELRSPDIYFKDASSSYYLKNLQFNFDFYADTFYVNNFNTMLNNGSLAAKGVYILGAEPQVVFSVKAKDVDLNKIFENKTNKINFQFSTSFDFNIVGHIKSPTIIGNTAINRMNAGKNMLGSAYADFIYDKDFFYLNKARIFQNHKNTAKAHGFIDIKDSYLNLNILAKNLAFEGFDLKQQKNIDGNFNLTLKAEGPLKTPYIQSIVRDCKINFADFNAENLNFELFSNPAGIFLNGGFAKLSSSDVNFAYIKTIADGGVYGYLTGKNLGYKTFNKAFFNNKFDVFDDPVTADIYLNGDKKKGYFYDIKLFSAKQKIKFLGFGGFLDNKENAASVLKLSNININSAAGAYLRPDFLSGRINLDSMLTFGKNNVSILGNFKLKDGKAASMPVQSGYFEAKADKDKINFENLTFMGNGVFLALKGITSLRGVDLKYTIANKNLYNLDKAFALFTKQKIKNIEAQNIKFEFSSSGAIKYIDSDLYLKGSLSIPTGLLGADIFSLYSNFKYSGGALTFKPAVLRMDDGSASLIGNINLYGKRSIHINILTDKLDIKKISNVTYLKNQDIGGKATSSFLITGNMPSPDITGNIDIFNLKLMGKVFRNLKTDIVTRNNQFIFSNVLFKVNRGEIYGLGRINKKGDMDFNFYAQNFPAEEILFLSNKSKNIKGAGKFNIKIFGTKDDPNLIAKLEYENITINDKAFSKTSADISFRNKKLTFAPLYIEEGKNIVTGERTARPYNSTDLPQAQTPQSAGRYKVEGTIDFSANVPDMNLNFTAFSASLSNIVAILDAGTNYPIFNSLQKDSALEGKTNLNLFLGGPLSNPAINLKVVLKEGLFGQTKVDVLNTDIAYKDKALTINSFDIKQEKGYANISGQINENDTNLTLKTDNFDIGIISPFMPKRHSLSGFLTSNLSAKNKLIAPEIDSSFKLANGRIDNFTFDEFNGKIFGSDGFLYFRDWKVLKDKHIIKGEGEIPVVVKKGGFFTSAPISFKAEFSEKDLSLFNIFGNFIDSSSGEFAGSLKIFGPLYDIKMNGSSYIKGGKANIKDIKTPLENINAKVSFIDNKLHFDNFNAKMGGGTFKVTGDIVFERLKPISSNLALKVDNVVMDSSKYYSGVLNGNLSFLGTNSARSLTGQMSALNGNLNLQDLRKLSSYAFGRNIKPNVSVAPSAPLAYNVDLILDRVWLNDQTSFLRTYLRSNGLLELRGKNKPTLKGQLNFAQGNIVVYNTNFRVTDGMAFFDGTENWIPKIDLEASTRIKDIDIFMELTGSLDRPIISFTSDPHLSEREIVTLLAARILPVAAPLGTGTFASQYVYGAVETSFIQPLVQSLGQNVFLGDVGFEYAAPGIWSVRLTKAIDKDEKFYVIFTRIYGLSGGETRAWGIEYRLQSRTSLLVENDNFGNYYYGLKARWQW